MSRSNQDLNSELLCIKLGMNIAAESICIQQIRASGSGGQNINKVATAVHLRFNIETSGLPDAVKNQLKMIRDRRILSNGTVLIKSKEHRTFARNREAAFVRLRQLILQSLYVPTKRIPTRPKRSSVRKRLDSKSRHSLLKHGRRKIRVDE